MGLNRTFFVLCAFAVSAIASTALADPATVGRGRSSSHDVLPAVNSSGAQSTAPSELLECNQFCQYRHSYETVLLQMTYLAQKSAAIQLAHEKGGRDQEVIKATETVCTVTSAKQCVEQYKIFAAYSLIKLRDQATYLQDSMATMTPGRQADGSLKPTSAVTMDGLKPGTYSTDVYTLEKMEEFYGKSVDDQGKQLSGQTLTKAKIKASWAELIGKGLSSATNTIDFSRKLDKKRVESTQNVGQSTNRQMYYRYERTGDGKEVQDGAFAKYRTTVIKKVDRDIARTPESGADIKRATSMENLKKDDSISYEAWTAARSEFGRALKAADGQLLPDKKGQPGPLLGDNEKPKLSGKSSTGVTMSGVEDADALMKFGGVEKTAKEP